MAYDLHNLNWYSMWQSLWHSSTLSDCLGTAWQMQRLSGDKAFAIISEEFCFALFERLNCGSLQQCGQCHTLGRGLEIAKHDGWNSTNGQRGFPHFAVLSSDGILQKHIPTPASGISSQISHFLECHLSEISGKIHVLKKVVSFGKTTSSDHMVSETSFFNNCCAMRTVKNTKGQTTKSLYFRRSGDVKDCC